MVRTTLWSAVLALAAAMAGAQPMPGYEIVNPGFETKEGTQPAGWTRFVTFPGRAGWAVDAAGPHTGKQSLRIDLSEKSRCAVSQYIRIKQEGACTLSSYLRAEPGIRVQLQVQWFQLSDWPRQVKYLSSDPPCPWVSPGEQWERVAATAKRPAEADLALLVIIIGNSQGPAGKAWVDDVVLEPGAYPEPLVANRGFEVDANADGHPDEWGPAVYGGGFELKQDTSVAHSGKASARLTGAKEHGDRSCYHQASPLFTPPQKVRLSFWYRGTGASALVMHLLTPAGVQRPGGGIDYGAITAAPALTDDWQQFSQEIEVPQEARDAGIMRLDIILYQKGEGTLWYDEVQVELLR